MFLRYLLQVIGCHLKIPIVLRIFLNFLEFQVSLRELALNSRNFFEVIGTRYSFWTFLKPPEVYLAETQKKIRSTSLMFSEHS